MTEDQILKEFYLISSQNKKGKENGESEDEDEDQEEFHDPTFEDWDKETEKTGIFEDIE